MRQLVSIAALALALTAFGCGGGGGGSSQPQHAPTISNLQYTPTSAPANSGTATVTGTIDFTDTDGNISMFTINIYSGSTLISSTPTSIQGASGVISGTFNITVYVGTSVQGSYTFGIFVTDSTGLQSNVLPGTFTVT